MTNKRNQTLEEKMIAVRKVLSDAEERLQLNCRCVYNHRESTFVYNAPKKTLEQRGFEEGFKLVDKSPHYLRLFYMQKHESNNNGFYNVQVFEVFPKNAQANLIYWDQYGGNRLEGLKVEFVPYSPYTDRTGMLLKLTGARKIMGEDKTIYLLDKK